MQETAEDLVRLQALLDRSYDTAGAHLRGIITPERRLSAEQLAERLTGMRLLTLATVTADGRPIAAPVDGFFYRGEWYFGSSEASLRFQHVDRRPWVSVAHVPAESLSVTAHGRARRINVRTHDAGGFRDLLLGYYAPQFDGAGDFIDGNPYARVEADRMFTFSLDSGDS